MWSWSYATKVLHARWRTPWYLTAVAATWAGHQSRRKLGATRVDSRSEWVAGTGGRMIRPFPAAGEHGRSRLLGTTAGDGRLGEEGIFLLLIVADK
jgi:hypothetical protein